jgi:cyclopropane fatty-acyl-phospholipid synthase-like methyltransferase
MPYSHDANKDYIRKILQRLQPKTILDVGAGAGKYSILANQVLSDFTIDAVEVWEPYIERFDLNNKYDNVLVEDVRNLDNFNYDLVIFGDILEHMTKEEAQSLWSKVSTQAKASIIAIPVTHCPQGHWEGNPYEEHIKDDWTHEEVLESFPGLIGHEIFTETATYWAKFKIG